MTVPECTKGHGPMVLRPDAQQTLEQRWCGTWWDCTFAFGPTSRCRTSFLAPSPELVRSLANQAARCGAGA